MSAKRASLHLVDDNMLLRSFILDPGTCTIGRSHACDFVVDGKLVSRTHARITVRRDEHVIEDLASANGTYLNGRLVQRARLKHGDEIGIGDAVLVFDSGTGIKGISDQTRIETPGTETQSIVSRYESLAKKIRHRGVVRELSRYHRQVLKSREKLGRLANRDRLTGIFNRGYFDKKIVQLVEEFRRARSHLSLIFIDIDHFKKINDTFGHARGDAALKVVAHLVRSALRQDDVVVRYGGEEFVVLCLNMKSNDAYATAESLRRLIEETAPEILNFKITVSCGIASFPEQCPGAQALIECADRALYQAKASGRNRVVKYDGPGHDRQL